VTRHVIRHYTSRVNVLSYSILLQEYRLRSVLLKDRRNRGTANSTSDLIDAIQGYEINRVLYSGPISGCRSIDGSRGHRRVRGRLQARTDFAGRSAVRRQRFPAQSKISREIQTTLCLFDAIASWDELGAIRKRCVYHAKGRRFRSVKVEANGVDFAIYFDQRRLETLSYVSRETLKENTEGSDTHAVLN